MEGERICSDSTALRQNKRSSNPQTASDGEVAAHLPEEIIQDILSRLPVKFLLKCRCVSKTWLSLISSSRFVKTHLKFSAENEDFANHRILFTLTKPNFDLKQCSVNSLLSEPRPVASDVDYPNKGPYSAVWVVGSCNGIVCVAINETDVFLWNPSTRKSKELPQPGVEMKPGFYYIWGFGFSKSEDDYKVVGLFCEYGDGGLQESMVKIYSLKADSWKRIEDFSYGVPFDDTGKFASGKLHFTASKGMDFESRWNIVSLDMESEAYGIVEQPNYGEGCSDLSLELIGGYLSVLCDYQMKQADVWVMKVYGDKESWSKVASVPYLYDPDKFVYTNPLLIMPNGEILLVFRERFVVYNPKDGALRCPRIRNVHRFLEADVYFESLVPL